MLVLRQLLVAVLLIGVLVAGLALVGLIIIALVRTVRSLPTDSTMTAAWIGFAGSIAGSLITIVVACFALWPAYRQAGEAQRASAVQAGQILRARLSAADRDFEILLKGIDEPGLHAALRIESPTVTREAWLNANPDKADLIRKTVVRLEDIHYDLAQVMMGVELPDLDRWPYAKAVQRLKNDFSTVLDGRPRPDNGGLGPELSAEAWRTHAAKTLTYLDDDWSKAHLNYNNKIINARNLLRHQIIQADRQAVGRQAYEQFMQGQKFSDDMDDERERAAKR